MKKYIDSKNLFFLFFIHIVSHFLPFERATIGQDEFESVLRKSIWLKNFIINPDRPLMFIWGEINKYLIENYNFIELYLIILSSFFTVLLSYFLLKLILKNVDLAFLIMILYSLIINKLEIFHSSVFIHVNLSTSIYLLSTILFILFIEKNNNKIFYILSLIFYSMAILWYEIGILLPVVFVYFYFLKVNHYKLHEYIKIILPFILVVGIYLIYRLSGSFGLINNIGRQGSFINLIPGLIDIFHHHFGRYILRNILYGTYLFFQIDKFWLFLILLADLILLLYTYVIIRKIEKIYINKKFIFLSLLLIFITLIPNIVVGSTGGRHLIISSIGSSLILLFIIFFFTKIWKKLYMLLVFIFLIICQGNAWAQIVTLRISNSICLSINNYSNEIINSEIVIINRKSFANNIPFTMINRDFNILHTYYGAQALENNGLRGMINYSLKNNNYNKEIYVSASDLKIEVDKIVFTILKNSDYRNFTKETIEVLNQDVFVIDYAKVYKNGYLNGKNAF